MIRLMSLCSAAILLTGVVTAMSGCGADNGLNLARVSGKVTYKGEPVKNGTVFFMPDETKGTVGPPGLGSITSDGSYILSTESAGDGVIVGHHKVGITGVEPVSISNEPAPDPASDPAGFMKAKAQAAKQASRSHPKEDEDLFTDKGGKKFRFVVPKKFSNPDESGIIVKVDGRRTIDFNIDETGKVTTGP